MGKPHFLRIQHAVCGSKLDREERHLLMVMALLANSRTGIGFAGQKTIAAAMGCSDRHVRDLLSGLAQRKDSPVTVTRRRRGAATGRTSDQYELLFAQPEHDAASGTPAEEEPHAASEPKPKRNHVPVQAPLKLVPQPEHGAEPSGTPRHPKRNGRSEDLRSDRRSDRRSTSAPRRNEASKAPIPGAHDLKLHYVAEYSRTRIEEPQFGPKWPRAMKSFGELVTTFGLDKAKAIVTSAMDAEFGSVTPWAICDKAVDHQGKGPRRGNGKRVQVQRGTPTGVDASAYGQDGAAALLNGGGE